MSDILDNNIILESTNINIPNIEDKPKKKRKKYKTKKKKSSKKRKTTKPSKAKPYKPKTDEEKVEITLKGLKEKNTFTKKEINHLKRWVFSYFKKQRTKANREIIQPAYEEFKQQLKDDYNQYLQHQRDLTRQYLEKKKKVVYEELKRRERELTKMIKEKTVNAKEEKFVQGILSGKPKKESLLKAFPERKQYSDRTNSSYAWMVFKRPHVYKRYMHLLAQYQQANDNITTWTREKSIETLKFVIDKNKEEIERIHRANEEELELLAELMENDPNNAHLYIQEILQKQKVRRMSDIHNKGIISAISELNKMQGFNEENINLNTMVMFECEDDLED